MYRRFLQFLGQMIHQHTLPLTLHGQGPKCLNFWDNDVCRKGTVSLPPLTVGYVQL